MADTRTAILEAQNALLNRAARFEAVAVKNECPPGKGPALVAEKVLTLACRLDACKSRAEAISLLDAAGYYDTATTYLRYH